MLGSMLLQYHERQCDGAIPGPTPVNQTATPYISSYIIISEPKIRGYSSSGFLIINFALFGYKNSNSALMPALYIILLSKFGYAQLPALVKMITFYHSL